MFGTHQLSQSLSYLTAQFDDNDCILICKTSQELLNKDLKIITKKLPSRHMTNKQYRVYIRYVDGNTSNSIKGWYCVCKNGTRTLGCCCHFSALLYYLAYARHLPCDILKRPAHRLKSVLKKRKTNRENEQKKQKANKKLKQKKNKTK
jgi:hypothetical protein